VRSPIRTPCARTIASRFSGHSRSIPRKAGGVRRRADARGG